MTPDNLGIKSRGGMRTHGVVLSRHKMKGPDAQKGRASSITKP
jgi:hypothetical protein